MIGKQESEKEERNKEREERPKKRKRGITNKRLRSTGNCRKIRWNPKCERERERDKERGEINKVREREE